MLGSFISLLKARKQWLVKLANFLQATKETTSFISDAVSDHSLYTSASQLLGWQVGLVCLGTSWFRHTKSHMPTQSKMLWFWLHVKITTENLKKKKKSRFLGLTFPRIWFNDSGVGPKLLDSNIQNTTLNHAATQKVSSLNSTIFWCYVNH